MESIGLNNVKTYIQSGNVVFQSDSTDQTTLSQTIKTALCNSHGFAPDVFLLSIQELRDAITSNPFPEGVADPKTLHLSFLAAVPENPDFARLDRVKTKRERFKLINKVFYFHAPDGIGRSKLAMSVEKVMGVTMTARNWRTVNKIMSLTENLTD